MLEIELLRKTQYDSDNSEHEQLLLQVGVNKNSAVQTRIVRSERHLAPRVSNVAAAIVIALARHVFSPNIYDFESNRFGN